MAEVFALNNNVKYRICFTKTDKMQYIGHLDLLTYFQRAIKRAGLPIAYSLGFNPHQLTSFAIPLPLGMESVSEFVDIQLKEYMDCDEIKARLNNASTTGIEILDVRKLAEGEKGCAAIVCAAHYKIELDAKIESFDKKFAELNKKPEWIVEKRGKKAVKEVDIKPEVYSFEILPDCEKTTVLTCIATGSGVNLKPELLLSFIYSNLGLELNMNKINIARQTLLKQGEFGFESL